MYKVRLSCKQFSFLYSAQVAKVFHMPFGKYTLGKEILVSNLPVLFLQEWRMIAARMCVYVYIHVYIYMSINVNSILQITQQLSIWRDIAENTTKIF